MESSLWNRIPKNEIIRRNNEKSQNKTKIKKYNKKVNKDNGKIN